MIPGESPAPDSRKRLKILRVSADVLLAFFQMDGTRLIRAAGMPDDAKIIGTNASAHFVSNQLLLMIHSETFPEVPESHPCPELDITFSWETPFHHLEKQGFHLESRVEITIESAGVDPAHQTSKCDHCACQLVGDEGIQTCTQYRHVTLCEECYKKAGNTVR